MSSRAPQLGGYDRPEPGAQAPVLHGWSLLWFSVSAVLSVYSPAVRTTGRQARKPRPPRRLAGLHPTRRMAGTSSDGLRRRRWLMPLTLTPLILQVGLLAFLSLWSFRLYDDNFGREPVESTLESVDVAVLSYDAIPNGHRGHFNFTVTQPGSADPSTLRVSVAAPVPGDSLPETYPLEARLWVSESLGDALTECRAHLIRITESGPSGYDVPIHFEPLDDHGAFDSAIGDTFSYELGTGERVSGGPVERATDWRKVHGPIQEARIPLPVDAAGRALSPDGYAAPELTCEIAHDYLWHRRGVEYVLALPRLVIQTAPAESSGSGDADDAVLAVTNLTKVATSEGFFFLRGRDDAMEYPHTTEFFWTDHSGTTRDDRMTRITWESALAFGSRQAASDRDLALLLLGLNLALIVQLVSGVSLWLWDRMRRSASPQPIRV